MSEGPQRPSLLYICALWPSLKGGGTPMRAGMVLEALTAWYRVSLLVAPAQQYFATEPSLPERLRPLCEEVKFVAPGNDKQKTIELAGEAYRDRRFDVIHVFRLSALPFARTYVVDGPVRARKHIDMDDVDSKTYRRIAALYRLNGEPVNAAGWEALAKQREIMETSIFQMFDRIYVCSEVDRRHLAERNCKAEVRILRNAVRPPAFETGFRFLFVGSLAYYPNVDAVRFFCREILPIVRSQAPKPFFLDVIGVGGIKQLQDVAGDNVNLIGEVPEVGPYYQAAGAVVVPLRAGGGTRIKILEAFSYERPVVSTSLGAEGLETLSGEHILVADSPEGFAAACLRLMSDDGLARRLVRNSADLLQRRYTLDSVGQTLAPAG